MVVDMVVEAAAVTAAETTSAEASEVVVDAR